MKANAGGGKIFFANLVFRVYFLDGVILQLTLPKTLKTLVVRNFILTFEAK